VFGSLLEQGRFTASNFALESLNHPDGLNNFRTSITLRQPLFDQWQTRSGVNRAEIGRKRSDLQTDMARQRLLFEVIRSYYGAVLADELLAATNASVKAANENCRKTKDMVDVGMVAESDSLVASVELANMEQQNLEAQGGVINARAALNIAIGDKLDADSELTERLLEKYFPVEDQPELIRIALEHRPDYQQAEFAIQDSREQTKAAKGQRLPRVDAFGGYGYSSPYITNGSGDYTVGLSLTYNIFDAGRKARIEESAGAESLAGFEKEKLSNQITLEVVSALQSYKTARAKIQVSIKSVSQSEEALRILQDRYKVAISTFDAVLRAEAAVLKSKHDLLRARYEYYVSYAAILLATGRLMDVRAFD
jgi:outer membrane protein TolC